MQGFTTIKCCTIALCFMIVAAEFVAGAPSYSDYETGVRDLYELLLQKEALENRLQAQQALAGQSTHEVVRKANRSPSLRLRFGRRADPLLAAASPFMEHSAESGIAEN